MARKKSVTNVTNKTIGQLESEVVKAHCDGIEGNIKAEVEALGAGVERLVTDFQAFARELDLNIDKSHVEYDGTNIRIELKFGIDRDKIEKRERSTAIAKHLSKVKG